MSSRLKGVARLFGLVLLVAAILWLVEAQYHFLGGSSRAQALAERQLAMRFLGEYLAHAYPGQRAVVISNPFSVKSGQPKEVYAYDRAEVQGLKEGLGTAVVLEELAHPALRPEALANPRRVFINPNTTTPLSYLLADGALENIAAPHPNAAILVSLIGLPANITRSPLWQADDPRKFALLLPDLRIVGNQASIREAFKNRKIAVAILNKPGAPPEDQPLGSDLQAEFNRRFLLVTPDNIDQMMQAFPRLF